MTEQTRRALRTGLLCAGGLALLLHPVSLLAFGVGTWAGYQGKDRIRQFLENRGHLE